jgi:fatty acid desaturase
VHWQGWWVGFVVAVLVPLWLAAAIQTLDKFTQHLGLHGDTVLSATRTIAAERGIGKILSLSVQRVDHHGAHHLDASVPYYHLPEATKEIYVEGHEPGPIYGNHFRAVLAMLPSMLDPKIGVQWLERGAPSKEE